MRIGAGLRRRFAELFAVLALADVDEPDQLRTSDDIDTVGYDYNPDDNQSNQDYQ